MATVADLVRLQRQALISGRVAEPSVRRVLPESAKQAAAKAIAAQAIYAGGLSQRVNDVSVSARAMQAPSLGALERERLKPCPTGYQRDARGECVIVIETGTVANSIPAEYRFGPTLSQFRPVLDFNGAVPGRSTAESLQTLKRNLGRLSKGLNGLGAASRRTSTRLGGLGATVSLPGLTSGSTSTSTTLTSQQIIDGLNAQITSLSAQVTKLQSDYAALDSACQKTADNLASRTAALNTCNATLATTKTALDAANAKIATLTAQVDSLTAALASKTTDYDAQVRLVADRDATIASVNATLADVRNQLSAALAAAADLTAKLADAAAQSDAQKATITSVQTDLANTTAAVDQLKAALAAASLDNQRLAQQVTSLTADKNKLTLDLSTATTKASMALAENGQLRSAMDAATKSLASANSAIAALKAVCSTLSASSGAVNGLGALHMDAMSRGSSRWRSVRRGDLGGLGAMLQTNFGPSVIGDDVFSNIAASAGVATTGTTGGPAALAVAAPGAMPDYREMYADCLKLAERIKAELDAKAGFIDPKNCPTKSCPTCPVCPTGTECPACPECQTATTESSTPNWLPMAVLGVSAAKLFL